VSGIFTLLNVRECKLLILGGGMDIAYLILSTSKDVDLAWFTLSPRFAGGVFFGNKKSQYTPYLSWCGSKDYHPCSAITLFMITASVLFFLFSLLFPATKFSQGLDEGVIGNPE